MLREEMYIVSNQSSDITIKGNWIVNKVTD